MRKSIVVAGLAGTLLAAGPPAAASAQEPLPGCKENGQMVASFAQAPGPFGETVTENVPINDNIVQFKLMFCAD
jgi:hypothetical protein